MLSHLRDSIRHVLAAVLMLGTASGTIWTFSNGQLSLAGAWERITSVGGIAAALEIGAIFTGLYIGELRRRIKTARRRELVALYTAQVRELYRWFYAVVGISCVANLIFRAQQLDNLPLAAFVALAPAPLIVLFTIKLQPLPDDYRDIGARATGRALTRMVAQAERTMLRSMRRMAKGKRVDMQQLGFAASVVRIYAATDEQHALDHALTIAAPAPLANLADVDSDADPWLRCEDLMAMYGVSLRTAQARMARVPGRRKVPNSNASEAPRSAVIAVFGDPQAHAARRRDAQERADEAQSRAEGAPSSASFALVPASLVPSDAAYSSSTISGAAGDPGPNML